MPGVRRAILIFHPVDRPSSAEEAGLPGGANPVSHLWARRVVAPAARPARWNKTKGGELTVNLFLVLAALLALPALGLAIRMVVSLLAWLIAIAAVLALGMLVLLELAKHVKLL
jgi:hypothetical protein